MFKTITIYVNFTFDSIESTEAIKIKTDQKQRGRQSTGRQPVAVTAFSTAMNPARDWRHKHKQAALRKWMLEQPATCHWYSKSKLELAVATDFFFFFWLGIERGIE